MTSTSLQDVFATAQGLSPEDRDNIFQHLFRRLATYKTTLELYAQSEHKASTRPERHERKENFNRDVQRWAQGILGHAWVVCDQNRSGSAECPVLDSHVDTFIGDLPPLPPLETFSKMLNTILFLHITSAKEYSARTRAFLFTFGPLDEQIIVSTLKNPDRALEEAQRQANQTTANHAQRGRTSRLVGIGLGAVAGGLLIGVTGGLAAPLVGVATSTLLGWIGVGGTAAGLLASGLAGSSLVCGALFGVYGARSSARMVENYTREIRDLAFLPVLKLGTEETLAVRICLSGWLSSPDDIKAPWTLFRPDVDTFALRWEMEALQQLSNALTTLAKSDVMQYLNSETIMRTVVTTLLTRLTPVMLLRIGQIIDNPWMNARALAVKAGAVLGDLLAQRVFGARPVTLTGYSLGALVIFEALKYLAERSPSETGSLIQDVFLFGTPAPTDAATWTGVRRVVAGRLVNGYSTTDYVLAILCRVSDATWQVAGLGPVDVMGVENIKCDVDGHLKWRARIGKSLQQAGASGLVDSQVDQQVQDMDLEDELTTLTV